MFPPILTVTSHALQDLGSMVTWHKRFTEIEYLLKDGHAVHIQVYQGYLPEGKMGMLCLQQVCVFCWFSVTSLLLLLLCLFVCRRHEGPELLLRDSRDGSQGRLPAEGGDGEVPAVYGEPDWAEDGL